MKTTIFTAACLVAAFAFTVPAPSSFTLSTFKSRHCKIADTVPKTMAMQGRYKDITTGDPLYLVYDPQQKRVMNSRTNEPVDFYINTATGDTISGNGHYVVNNYLMKQPDNTYAIDTSMVHISNNRYWSIKDNRELKTDGSWDKNLRSGKNRMQRSGRDSLQ